MKNLIALIVLIMAAASFSTKKEDAAPVIIKCQLNQQGKHIKVVCPKVENNRKPAYIVW